MCGENAFATGNIFTATGSSPRVRGKHRSTWLRRRAERLIPACAGKTISSRTGYPSPGAHPRVCGENFRGFRSNFKRAGSSPRVRGKRFIRLSCRIDNGLIPACAGKTHKTRLQRAFPRAHPRVCGENPTLWDLILNRLGSSPRVRGKHTKANRLPWVLGLIPACAGKTGSVGIFAGCLRAHPRVCGENVYPSWFLWPWLWLIPACAGKTRFACIWRGPGGAHPRVCGENTERSGVLTLRSVRSWKTLSFPPSLKVTHCWTFMQLSLSRIRL